ncbi:hypothetical protein [Thiobacillus sedimenti]|uniref:Uncharacterized protein n=1 Tax=Thiobacillus sedimenti TaxID=3110231 RepID=A0ABZ1CR51_9PROT|nr:hypothetical protein [Thiobacillus sp. SCUT-2]WRS40398.1 hypothetical protein VA613_05870 [Thiobacillus sp. SCUT-2]
MAAFVILMLGAGDATAASVVPFFQAGYVLEPGVLVAVLMPFLLWGLFVESLHSAWLITSGLALLAVNVALVAAERFAHYNGYRDDLIYWVPTLAAVAVLAVTYAFGRRSPYA